MLCGLKSMATASRKQRDSLKKILLGYCKLMDIGVEICWKISAVLLGGLIAAEAIQIFMRSLFNSPIYGIEEGVTAALVWFAALGAIVVTKQNGHAQVEFFMKYIPEKIRKVVHSFAFVLGGVMGVLMVEGGNRLYKVQAKAVPQGGLPFGRVYYYALPMIIMGILLVLICLSEVIKIYVKDEKGREGGDII